MFLTINRILHGCLEIWNLFLVSAEQDIPLVLFNTRNKFHISAQPCNILYLNRILSVWTLERNVKILNSARVPGFPATSGPGTGLVDLLKLNLLKAIIEFISPFFMKNVHFAPPPPPRPAEILGPICINMFMFGVTVVYHFIKIYTQWFP